MTTDCIDHNPLEATAQRLHDAVIGLVVTVIFVVPVALAAFTLF